MTITHLFAGVAVSDFPAARRWYEALFGRPPDMLPKEGEAVWHVTTFGSVYVTADPARAGSALVTIAVSNLDEYAAALAAQGMSLDEQGAGSSGLRQLPSPTTTGTASSSSRIPHSHPRESSLGCASVLTLRRSRF